MPAIVNYLEPLGLREPPFAPTADPAFLYAAPRTRQVMDELFASLASGEGVLALTGEAGTGKTTVCRALIQRLDPDLWVSAYLPAPEVDARTLTLAIARALGARVPATSEGVAAVQRALGLHLLGLARSGRRALIIIDECQAISPDALEQVRQLTNLETSKRKLLNVLLVGQPALGTMLGSPAIANLQQRLGLERRLEALSPAEAAAYFEHRLKAAGYSRPPLLTRGASKALHHATKGVPRLLNALAHQALIVMHADSAERLQGKHVLQAAADSAALAPATRSAETRQEWFWRCTAALLLVGVLWTVWVAYQLRPRELVTPQAYAMPVQGRVAAVPEATLPPTGQAGTQDSTSERDPALLQSLGLPNAKIAAYSPNFALSLARLHMQRENHAAALAALDAAGEELANRSDFLYLRGAVLQGLGRNELAEEAFRRALGAPAHEGAGAGAR